MLSIGSFSLAAGLSIQVPVDAMRAVGGLGVGAVPAEHRERLRSRADLLTNLIEIVDRYTDQG
ncbi:hypothetical protein [Streptomyces griseorubiginosus]|uniref:hypothetical protein n=1 Tax=Streptomyces griseorubiginosus TaxID=67304 RepID=UPI0036E84870